MIEEMSVPQLPRLRFLSSTVGTTCHCFALSIEIAFVSKGRRKKQVKKLKIKCEKGKIEQDYCQKEYGASSVLHLHSIQMMKLTLLNFL